MNDEDYIKKLEDDNKRLEETLGKYVDRYGALLSPIVAVEAKESDTVTFGSLNGGIAQGNAFMTSNVQQFNARPETLTFNATEIKFNADNISMTIESEMTKAIHDVKRKLDDIQKRFFAKPKPRFKRYCRVTLKKLKRIFK